MIYCIYAEYQSLNYGVFMAGEETNVANGYFDHSVDINDFKKFIDENEPKLDLTKTVIAPSGNKVDVEIAFGVEFFRVFF